MRGYRCIGKPTTTDSVGRVIKSKPACGWEGEGADEQTTFCPACGGWLELTKFEPTGGGDAHDNALDRECERGSRSAGTHVTGLAGPTPPGPAGPPDPELDRWRHLDGTVCVAGWFEHDGLCIKGGGPVIHRAAWQALHATVGPPDPELDAHTLDASIADHERAEQAQQQVAGLQAKVERYQAFELAVRQAMSRSTYGHIIDGIGYALAALDPAAAPQGGGGDG